MARKDVVEKRTLICDTCEYRRENICDKCGCYIQMKVSFSLASCPEGKWDVTKEGEVINEQQVLGSTNGD